MFNEILSTNTDLSRSLKRLNNNMENKYYFRLNPFEIINGAIIEEDYSKKNRRASYYVECIFKNCNFFEAGFASSIFVKCEFVDCVFDFSNFQSCDFRKCKIHSTHNYFEIKGTMLMKSVFYECEFQNLFLNSVNLCSSVFNEGRIIHSKFNSCAFEDMVIKNTYMESINFSSQNFDFLKIDNIHTKDVVFPFPSIPCIIGGLRYVTETKDNVSFSGVGNTIITKKEYKTYIPDFINYYKQIKDYYVLANIMLSAFYDTNIAFSYIISGIEQAIKIHNFRKVRKYCQLLINSDFNIQHKKVAYRTISDEISKLPFTDSDQDSYNIHLREIRNMLITATDRPYLTLDIATNIQETETGKIVSFVKFIEELIQYTISEYEEHSIELRHNSDESFFIQVVSDPISLLTCLAAILECINYGKDFAKYIINKIKDKKKPKEIRSNEFKNTSHEGNNGENAKPIISANSLQDKQIQKLESLDGNNSIIINIQNYIVDNHIEIKGIGHSLVNTGTLDNKLKSSFLQQPHHTDNK